MTSTNVREQVVSAAGHYARTYPSVVNDVVNAITESGNVDAGKERLRALGYGGYAHLLDGVTLDSVGQATVSVDAFDKATACEVIRAFITTGAPHLDGAQGASEEQVTALLQIAGLEDVPEPVVEEPVEDAPVDAGLFRRLVEFARGHGFRG